MPSDAALLSPPLALVTVVMGLMFLVLSFRIILLRFKHKVGTGDGGENALHKAIRVHGNFAEWVPIALLCLFAADLRGASDLSLNVLGAILVLARLSHALGLSRSTWTSLPRTIGVAGTVTTILGASGLVLLSL
jgi:uncharacterized membrane protein YecN with MAPEG domain